MKINRFLPLIIPLLIYLLFQIYFFYPRIIYIVLVLMNLLIFFSMRQLSQESQVDKKWWNFLILPAVMSSFIIIYTLFLDNKTIIQSLFILDVIFLYFYIRFVYFYLIKPSSYEAFSIENITSYGNFLTFFLIATAIYGLQSFLDVSIWLLEIIILVLSAVILYQFFWANKIVFKKAMPYILIGCFILIELSWSISFLPLNFNISGLTLAICYYMLAGIIKNYLLDKLDSKRIKIYLTIGLTSLILILVTARWA